MADVAELHQEAREIKVFRHNELISQLFAISCHLPLSHNVAVKELKTLAGPVWAGRLLQVDWPLKTHHLLTLEKKLKLHGRTPDTHLTFTQHCNNTAEKVQQNNKVLKALAGSTYCCNKETFLTSYQKIGRSILSNCCSVWTPSPNDTKWSRLQRAQNSALISATGCLYIAVVAELHLESMELPVRQNNELISQQFAMSFHLPQHPCHQLCHKPPDERPERRQSLIGRSRPNIQQ